VGDNLKLKILTLTKISLGIFFILMIIGALHFSNKSVIYELTKFWLYYLFLAVSVYFLFKTAFEESIINKEYPISSYILLPLSFILFLGDIWILQTILQSDKDTYENIYVIVLIVAIFWLPIGFSIVNILDKILKFIRKKRK
jgi:hypothetical protein